MSKIAGELNAEMSKTIGSKEYNEWLNSPLTKALKRSFEQSITDPENQPSQYGTVTLAMYEHLEEQITASQQRVAELESLLKEAYADADSKRLDWMSARVHFYGVRRKDEFMEIVLDLSEYLPTVDFDLRKEIDNLMSNADIAAKAFAASLWDE